MNKISIPYSKGVTHLSDEIIRVHNKDSVSWVVFQRDHYLSTDGDGDLEQLFDHKVEVKICDEKAAVSNRAKHDKPKCEFKKSGKT